ncbi:MAG TPA: TetR/AcrR family transcriptional regulator [Chondromyces sp.]|nr:TetR/AcrR family transcriptional regulator [Chondromyces sp.]
MNERKQHVIKKAHQLFTEKGFQATSVQDILDSSGISKGTFYNYFSSKNELFKAVFLHVRSNYEAERNELLIGENLDNIEIFIKQIDLFLWSNKKNKLFALIEEVFVSNDPDLKQFIKNNQLRQINWIYHRLVDLFGEEKRPYLLDCAVLFSGMLHHTIHYHYMMKEANFNPIEIIRYCVGRLTGIVNEVSETRIQLLEPELLSKWLPDSSDNHDSYFNELRHLSAALRKMVEKALQDDKDRIKYLKTIDFIQDELINQKAPRHFLIENSLLSLKLRPEIQSTEEFGQFENLLLKHVLKDS